LSNKTLFVSVGSDGMTMDSKGNVYLTEDGVLAFDAAGKLLERIPIPTRPTNVCFAGPDRKTLFITARSSVYSIRMNVAGVSPWPQSTPKRNMQRPASGQRPSQPGDGQRDPGGGQGRSRNPIILALDANGDGEISAEEISNGAAALLKLDANGDGRISREESRPAEGGRGRRP
jgi:hypothetical protein